MKPFRGKSLVQTKNMKCKIDAEHAKPVATTKYVFSFPHGGSRSRRITGWGLPPPKSPVGDLGGRQTPTRDVWGAGAPKERKTISNNGNVKKKRTHVFRHMRDASCGPVGTTRNHRHVPADGHNGPRRKPPTQQELCLKNPAVLLGTRGRPGYACM